MSVLKNSFRRREPPREKKDSPGSVHYTTAVDGVVDEGNLKIY